MGSLTVIETGINLSNAVLRPGPVGYQNTSVASNKHKRTDTRRLSATTRRSLSMRMGTMSRFGACLMLVAALVLARGDAEADSTSARALDSPAAAPTGADSSPAGNAAPADAPVATPSTATSGPSAPTDDAPVASPTGAGPPGDDDPTEPPAAGMADPPSTAPSLTAADAGSPVAPPPTEPAAPSPPPTKVPRHNTPEPTTAAEAVAPAAAPTSDAAVAPTPSAPAPTPTAPAPTPSAPAPTVDDTSIYDNTDNPDETDETDYTLNPPTDPPVVYVPPDDDPVKDQDGDYTDGTADGEGFTWNQGETPEEMVHDPNVVIVVGVLCGLALILMIFTAQQMSENPDGICASLCRLFVSCTCCIWRSICPCLACCCGKKRSRNHIPIANGNDHYTHDLELT